MRETALFRSPLFSVTEFHCPADDPAWTSSNLIQSRSPILVFPRQPVGIRHSDRPRVLATPNLVMLYNPAQEFERELRDARGDSCIYITIHEPALAELEHASEVVADGRLAGTYVPCPPTSYLQQHVLGRRLSSHTLDPLGAEEATWALVSHVLARRFEPRTTTRTHYELAEAAKERIVATLGESLSLAQLGRQLGVSPFHLARTFRAQTGFTLHQYRTQLRLRRALVELGGDAASLTRLAFELGFASHSHFTDTFRREFGVPPSVVRRIA
jgi:AraC family transcriptional regulator